MKEQSELQDPPQTAPCLLLYQSSAVILVGIKGLVTKMFYTPAYRALGFLPNASILCSKLPLLSPESKQEV